VRVAPLCLEPVPPIVAVETKWWRHTNGTGPCFCCAGAPRASKDEISGEWEER